MASSKPTLHRHAIAHHLAVEMLGFSAEATFGIRVARLSDLRPRRWDSLMRRSGPHNIRIRVRSSKALPTETFGPADHLEGAGGWGVTLVSPCAVYRGCFELIRPARRRGATAALKGNPGRPETFGTPSEPPYRRVPQ